MIINKTTTQTEIDTMVNRFLGWPLPKDFSPDCGISFKKESDYDHPTYGRNKYEPTGTNLFSADQAKAMITYLLAEQEQTKGHNMTIELAEPDKKIIYKDANGVEVEAMQTSGGGMCIGGQRTEILDVDGHYYSVLTGKEYQMVKFQLGPVPANGVNGLTNEALLAILIHRTKFLDAKFGCDENKRAISHMEEALVNFEVRTARRMVRGVEGKLVV